MDVYIKAKQKYYAKEKKRVTIGDIAEVIASGEAAKLIKNIVALKIDADKKKNFVISITDLILLIQKAYPKCCVHNLGESDTVVEYQPKSQPNIVVTVLKTIFVVLVLLVGSATAIMSFHTDAQIPKVFQNYYQIFFGKQSETPLLLDIPYSIGLAAGIILFFNHFLGKKMTDDPTPIEVEMTVYESDVNETVVEKLNAKKR